VRVRHEEQAGQRSGQERRARLQVGRRRGRARIVIEQVGALKLYDFENTADQDPQRAGAGDLPQVRPHFVKVDPKRIRNFGISPTGKRAVMEAWGEIFTVPPRIRATSGT